MHYLKKTRAMLPVAFEEFGVVYMFKLLVYFHYNKQISLVKLFCKFGNEFHSK